MIGAETKRVGGLRALLALAVSICALVLSGAGAQASSEQGDGFVRLVFDSTDIDSLDPALSYTGSTGVLLDTTCARLVSDGPEVAARLPRVSRDRRTFHFTLRSGFRFSDGAPVQASAFARAIDRTLAPQMKSPWAAYTSDIVGADAVLAGKTEHASGVVARGSSLTIRLKRPTPDFLARTGFMCAVPPDLPADREGNVAFPAAGPYYVAEYRPGERAVIRRNPYYGGKRPQRVEGFTVDIAAISHDEVVDRIERGEADWGWATAPVLVDAARGLVRKYGVNRSRFFVKPGFIFRGFALNTSRPLFADNPKLRRAVNFAIDRAALRRAGGGALESRLTDQYLPPGMAGFKDVQIYRLEGPDLRRARALARGNTRDGKAVLYTLNTPPMLAFAQTIRQNLAKIGLDVQIKGVPRPAYFGRLGATGPYDIGFAPWLTDYDDPYAVLNVLFDGRFVGSTNWSRLDSPEYNRLLRRTSLLQGAARYRAYGSLDVKLAREASPVVAIDYLNEATFVSERLGCVRLIPHLDLAAVCLDS